MTQALVAVLVLGWANVVAGQTTTAARIGVLTFDTASDSFRKGFRDGLRDYGYVDGKNIVIEWRSAQGRPDLARLRATELVNLKVSVIVAAPTPAVQAAQAATTTIPIVMAPAGDPVGTGFVESLARPGRNITGFTTGASELGGKLLETIMDVRPGIHAVGVLLDPYPFGQQFLHQLESAAANFGVRINPAVIQEMADFDRTFAELAKAGIDAVIVQPRYATRRVAELANQYRIPSITTGIGRDFPEAGGLMYYGTSGTDQSRRAATYVAKILKGAKPAELPVEQPTTFELVVNQRTAKALGISLPRSVLLRADRVIE